MNLPFYKITRDDGSSYVTSMAQGITLALARDYFIGQLQVSEAADGKETYCEVVAVERAARRESLVSQS